MTKTMKKIYDSMEKGRFYTLDELVAIHSTLDRKVVKCNTGMLLYTGAIEKIVDLEIKQAFYRKPLTN